MKITRLANSKFSYIRRGKVGKPKILLLHPFFSSYEYYLLTMKYLEKEFDMLSLDIPGFGRSRLYKGEDYSLPNIADHVMKFCSKVRFKPFNVVGSSLGGMISAILAANYSDIVQKTLFHAAPLNSGCINLGVSSNLFEMASKNKEIIKRIQKIKNQFDSEVIMTLITAVSQEYKGIKKRQETLYNGIKHASFETAAEVLKGINNVELKLYLKNVKTPSLVVIGDSDLTVYFKCAKRMHKLIKGSHLKIVKGGVHPIFLQKPLIMANIIRKFINEESNS